MARLGFYYLFLSVFFMALSVLLPYVSGPFLLTLSEYTKLIFQAGSAAGVFGFQVILLLLVVTFVAVEILAFKAKGKLFGFTGRALVFMPRMKCYLSGHHNSWPALSSKENWFWWWKDKEKEDE
jgi:hypothetical protein